MAPRRSTETNLSSVSLVPTSSDQDKALEKIVDAAISLPIESVTTSASSTNLSSQEVNKVIKRLGDLFGIDSVRAFVAVALLFLKGAANKGAPSQMQVDIIDHEGTSVSIQKHDVVSVYTAVTGNMFIRRLAETLSTQISRYAETNYLQGDLASSIETTIISSEEEPLTLKEKAWASSFCQKNPLLISEAPRIAKYLAIDYQKRFSKRKKTETAKGTAKTQAKTSAKKAKEQKKAAGKTDKK